MKFKRASRDENSVGLYIDGGRVHGVLLGRSDQGLAIERIACGSFGEGLGGAASVDMMRSVLAELAPPKGCPIHVGMTFDHFDTTHVNVGDLPLGQLNRMVEMAYRKEVLLGDDPVIFDYEHTGIAAGMGARSESIHAFSVEASRKEQLETVMTKARQKLSSVFPSLFALRNFVLLHDHPGATALLVLDDKELRIAIVYGGKYIFIRAFQSARGAFLDVITKLVEQPVTFAELEEALDPNSDVFDTMLSLEIRSAFSFITERMQKQIERALKFYSDRPNTPPIEKILLYADSTVVAQNMVDLLQSNYEHPVLNLHLKGVAECSIGPVLPKGEEARYTLAAGAAMATPETCPNLLHTCTDEFLRRKGRRIKVGLIGVLGVLGLACLLAFVLELMALAPLKAQRGRLEQEWVVSAERYTPEFMEAKSQLALVRLAKLHEISQHYLLQGAFYELCRLLPPKVTLESFQAKVNEGAARGTNQGVVGTMVIEGVVTEPGLRQQALLTKFLVKLGGSPLFSNISSARFSPQELSEYAQLNVTPFRISLDLIYGTATGSGEGGK